jgi:UDP-2,4-diacetamido-2,4,6-trideoxy-beta-L-altropyranose hydrolase
VLFAQAETTPALKARLGAEHIDSVPLPVERGSPSDSAATIALARSTGATLIIADGYCFGSAWQKQIRASGLRLLLIDDNGQADEYHADVILNQNLWAKSSLYASRDPRTRLLLGTRYALLRREFLAAPAERTIREPARKVLVTLGGSDPDNVTMKVVEALRQLKAIEAVVVIGGSNPHSALLKATLGAGDSALRCVIDAPRMPELMAWADVAVAAAGSTVWELAFMGVPTVLVVTANNQAGIAEALHGEGVSLSLGFNPMLTAARIAAALRGLLADSSLRQEMSRKGRQLVDGLGVDRVLTSLAVSP